MGKKSHDKFVLLGSACAPAGILGELAASELKPGLLIA
jgi:hypothetical protein